MIIPLDLFSILIVFCAFLFRRKQAVEDLAVKPVTQFPVEISNEDAFSSFKNVRNVTIKKVKYKRHNCQLSS